MVLVCSNEFYYGAICDEQNYTKKNDFNNLELHELFTDLKAYEFELKTRSSEESTWNHFTKALVMTVADSVPKKLLRKSATMLCHCSQEILKIHEENS